MTFGIDTSTHQRGLSIPSAVTAGAQFNIVKSVASYLKNLTVADDYQLITDRTIDAGLEHAKGHYAVPNNQNTPEVLAKFQWENRYRPSDTDVYMLDNEPLDDYPVFWRDDRAADYFEALHAYGVRYSQMWLYCPADLTRRSGPWPRINALRKLGLKIVWVSYGPNWTQQEPGPRGMVPDHEVLLSTAPGAIDGWDVRQFTSNWRVPGYSGRVDGNYSPLSVEALFGGEVSMEDQMRQFAAANETPKTGESSWDQMCGSLMWRFNDWRGWVTEPSPPYNSAYVVGTRSGRLDTNLTRAPVGAWHYFDIAGPGNGHVMQDARGGGLVCFSTGWHVNESLGEAIGFQSVPGYLAARPTARYMGWATNYAGGTISVAGTAGGGGTIIEGFLMALTDAQQAELYNAVINMQGYLWKGGDSVNRGIGDPGSVFGRIMDAQRQLTGANGFYKDINAISRLADIQAKLAALSSGGVDSDALSSQISAKVLAGLGESGGQGAPSVTLAQIEEAFGRALKSLVLRAE